MKIVPPVDRFGAVQSTAEVRVAQLLSQADLGEPATCLYSVHLSRHEYKRMSEIDFLIVMNGFVLVIEVKGGRLARREGLWTFTDRYGQVHEKRESPFEQARTAMFALESSMRKRISGLQAAFGTMIITPDQALEPDIEWAPEEHVGPAGMTVANLEAAFKKSARLWRSRTPAVTSTDMADMLRVLRPDFDRVPRLAMLAGSLEQDFVRLAHEQYEALQGSEVNRRLFVTGGAGSGKTLLAVESARRADSAGQRVLLTCKSAAVVDLMQRQLSGSNVICLPYEQTQGIEPVDVLVLDEAQDVMTLDDFVCLDGLLKRGLKDGQWRMFSDPNNQAHVDGGFDPAVADELAGFAALYHLPYNCRNTAGIVQQTQVVTEADLGVAKAGEGPKVEYRRCTTDQEAATLLDAELKRLRQDEIPPFDVVVLSLRRTTGSSSACLTKAYRRHSLVDGDPVPGDVVRLATVPAFKGLEAAHVIVVDIDDLSEPKELARLYVAMTRPRVSLSLIVHDLAWAQMKDQTVGEGAQHAQP